MIIYELGENKTEIAKTKLAGRIAFSCCIYDPTQHQS